MKKREFRKIRIYPTKYKNESFAGYDMIKLNNKGSLDKIFQPRNAILNKN